MLGRRALIADVDGTVEPFGVLVLFLVACCIALAFLFRKWRLAPHQPQPQPQSRRHIHKKRRTNKSRYYKIHDQLSTSTQIGRGSGGTVIFEGMFGERLVAIKRIPIKNDHLALKEMRVLIEVGKDPIPNIVAYYALHKSRRFMYLSLERCTCNLKDLISNSIEGSDPTHAYHIEGLWTDGFPSEKLLGLMRGVVCGLMRLHELHIAHGDLKPENILISIRQDSLCAKISDMGIATFLSSDKSSGSGSLEWRSPEDISHKCHKPASDLFSLGCILFYCVSGGYHPFGEAGDRESNIVGNNVNLSPVDCVPEARDLISSLLSTKPTDRPEASQVRVHPMFWDSQVRLDFIRDASDRFEPEDRNTSPMLVDLERVAFSQRNWQLDIDNSVYVFCRKARGKNYRQTNQDLVRFIRNQRNHYDRLDSQSQSILGGRPGPLDLYFRKRFPMLLVCVYKVICAHCRSDDWVRVYFK